MYKKQGLKIDILENKEWLYEFAFVSKKLKGDDTYIEQNLKFIAQFVTPTNPNVNSSSFDVFHVVFCEKNGCKLVTFDKGFKKLQKYTNTKIDII